MRAQMKSDEAGSGSSRPRAMGVRGPRLLIRRSRLRGARRSTRAGPASRCTRRNQGLRPVLPSRFFLEHREYGGTGLGLSIVKRRLVEGAHGGIDLASKTTRPRGTVFAQCTLPPRQCTPPATPSVALATIRAVAAALLERRPRAQLEAGVGRRSGVPSSEVRPDPCALGVALLWPVGSGRAGADRR